VVVTGNPFRTGTTPEAPFCQTDQLRFAVCRNFRPSATRLHMRLTESPIVLNGPGLGPTHNAGPGLGPTHNAGPGLGPLTLSPVR
jgi:hypothetical protein